VKNKHCCQQNAFFATMSAIRWGTRGTRRPHFFRQWGYSQNRCQEVFTRGTLRSCEGLYVSSGGAWYWKFDKISNDL